jgi:uncharacterized membrane protein YheB (UPF0754 family)
MNTVVFWLIPPAAGAIIGYVTNAVAIKMLFRPLKELRFFGKRFPFTPGILPRERRKLAESIGGMVERELLTSEVLRERLAKTEVRQKIGSTMSVYTGQMAARPLEHFFTEKDFPFAEFVNGFVNSDVFDFFLEEIIRNWAIGKNSYLEKNEKISFWLKSRFRDIGGLFVPTARGLVKDGLVREMKSHAQGEPSLLEQAMRSVIKKYPGITLGEFLSMGESKKQLADTFLTNKIAGTLDENVEGALSSIDVKALVIDRINSLDMLRVEKIILDVMAGQLKWINFFGGILGALIGLLQVILSFFMG